MLFFRRIRLLGYWCLDIQPCETVKHDFFSRSNNLLHVYFWRQEASRVINLNAVLQIPSFSGKHAGLIGMLGKEGCEKNIAKAGTALLKGHDANTTLNEMRFCYFLTQSSILSQERILPHIPAERFCALQVLTAPC